MKLAWHPDDCARQCSEPRSVRAHQGLTSVPRGEIVHPWLIGEGAANALLDVLHRQKSAVIAARRIYRTSDHSSKSITEFRILRHDCLDDCHVCLKGSASVRNIGRLIFDDKVQIISETSRKN